MKLICVVGATGNIGRCIVEAIQRDHSAKVRCCVHSTAKPHGFTASKTLEVAEFSFDKPESVEAAFKKCDAVFLNTAGFMDFTIPTKATIEACKKVGVKYVVKLSAMGADAPFIGGGPNPHGIADKVLMESGLHWCIVRPTFFMSNFFMQAESIKTMGKFFGASAGGKVAHVDSQDIADIAALALVNMKKYDKKIYDITGPDAITDVEAAEILSSVVGKKIEYVDVSPEDLEKSLTAKGLPEPMVKLLVGLEGVKKIGAASSLTKAVEEVTGHPAHNFKAFAEKNKAAFA